MPEPEVYEFSKHVGALCVRANKAKERGHHALLIFLGVLFATPVPLAGFEVTMHSRILNGYRAKE